LRFILGWFPEWEFGAGVGERVVRRLPPVRLGGVAHDGVGWGGVVAGLKAGPSVVLGEWRWFVAGDRPGPFVVLGGEWVIRVFLVSWGGSGEQQVLRLRGAKARHFAQDDRFWVGLGRARTRTRACGRPAEGPLRLTPPLPPPIPHEVAPARREGAFVSTGGRIRRRGRRIRGRRRRLVRGCPCPASLRRGRPGRG